MPKTDMVRAYLESLLREFLQSDPLRDSDGDYPVGYGNGGFYVRIDDSRGADAPVVQVFAIALDNVEAGPELFQRLNHINAVVHFVRDFLVQGQVLVEADVEGLELSPAVLDTAMSAVGSAAQHFGPLLQGEFGGETVFAEKFAEKGEADPDDASKPPPGLYL